MRPKPRKRRVVTVIKERDPQVFEEKINTYYSENQGNVSEHFFVDNGSLIAMLVTIKLEFEEQPEQPATEHFHAKGVTFLCEDCPHLERTGDKRKKYFPCKYSQFDKVKVTDEACEKFYEELKQGILTPVGGDEYGYTG